MNIVIAANEGFAKQAAVVVASIATTHPSDPYRIFFVNDRLSPTSRTRIGGLVGPNGALEWVEAFVDARASANTPLPSASLLRLKIADFLPPEVDRAIYLDADVLVRSSLAELASVDLGDGLAAAVRDIGFPWVGRILPWRELGMAPASPYFNTGVLSIPIDRWRDEEIGTRAVDLLKHRRLAFGDQGALNVVLANRWTALDPKWNLQQGHMTGDYSLSWIVEEPSILDAAFRNPSVVHFHGAGGDYQNRPWLRKCNHAYTEEWFEILDTTPWAGWRPSQRLATADVFSRVRSAGKALLGR